MSGSHKAHGKDDAFKALPLIASPDQVTDGFWLLPRPFEREHDGRVAKPWKCRLRLHDWEDRENPETHAHYQVCRRCNAYRDTQRPSLGKGAIDEANRTNPGGLTFLGGGE
jgi:hypothetical protein